MNRENVEMSLNKPSSHNRRRQGHTYHNSIDSKDSRSRSQTNPPEHQEPLEANPMPISPPIRPSIASFQEFHMVPLQFPRSSSQQNLWAHPPAEQEHEQKMTTVELLNLVMTICGLITTVAVCCLVFRNSSIDRSQDDENFGLVQAFFILSLVFGVTAAFMASLAQVLLAYRPKRTSRVEDKLWVLNLSVVASFVTFMTGRLIWQWDGVAGWKSNWAVIVAGVFLLYAFFFVSLW